MIYILLILVILFPVMFFSGLGRFPSRAQGMRVYQEHADDSPADEAESDHKKRQLEKLAEWLGPGVE